MAKKKEKTTIHFAMYMIRSLLTKSSKENKSIEYNRDDDGSKLSHD